MKSLSAAAAFAATAFIAGCVTYSANEVASMSAVDLCEVQSRQGRNLSAEARQAIDNELQRRNDNCRNHAIELARRLDDFANRETYGKHDDP